MPLMHSENVEDCQLCADVLQHMIDQLKKAPGDSDKESNEKDGSAEETKAVEPLTDAQLA